MNAGTEPLGLPGGPLDVTVEPWLGAPARSYAGRPPTVVDVLDGAVRGFADAEAFADRPAGHGGDGWRRVTWVEFAELVEGAAARLLAEGLVPGDRVGVALPNSLDLAVALFACARAGLVMVGLNVRLRATQWAYQLAHSGPRLALAAPDLYDELARAAAQSGLADDRVRRVGDHLTGDRRSWTYTADQRPAEDATFAVVYTSGTTGRPKASRVVHRASVHSGMSYQRVLGLNGRDRTAVLFPLSYISALHAHVLPMALTGGACVLVADARVGRFLDVLADEDITWMYTVPSMWQRLLRSGRFTGACLPHLRLGAAGGAPVPGAILPAVRERFGHLGLVNVYGLTETHSPATMLLPGEWPDEARDGQAPATERGTVGRVPVGRPLPCMEARIVDSGGRDLPTGHDGELWLRGSLVTTGYAGDEAATRAAITDGWFHTGDVARIDADGHVHVLDRLKDMISRGGYKIYPAEVEDLLRRHPAVADAAVAGIPDRAAGEAVACWVVPHPGRQVRTRDVRRWVGEHLADYAVPRTVRIVDHLPLNPTGKVDKPALRRTVT